MINVIKLRKGITGNCMVGVAVFVHVSFVTTTDSAAGQCGLTIGITSYGRHGGIQPTDS